MVSTILKVYVTCVGILYVKFLATTMTQATETFAAGMRSPEDTTHVLAKGREQNYGLHEGDDDATVRKAKAVEIRWKRIVMNDVESIPLALFVFGAGVMAGAQEGVQVGVMVAYMVARICHTVAYAKGVQPYRAYLWRVGVLSILAGVINAIVAVYK